MTTNKERLAHYNELTGLARGAYYAAHQTAIEAERHAIANPAPPPAVPRDRPPTPTLDEIAKHTRDGLTMRAALIRQGRALQASDEERALEAWEREQSAAKGA